jgi:hypothetical protein
MGSGFKRISFSRHDISLDIHPEGEYKINDQRRAHGEERDINKPGSYPGCSNSQTVTDGRTYSEHLPFNESLYSVHGCNLKKID